MSGTTLDNSRGQWHLLDQQLAQGGGLVVAAVDRLGRRYLETMWVIYDLQCRGVRLRSLASNEGEWTRFLDADFDSPEALMSNTLVLQRRLHNLIGSWPEIVLANASPQSCQATGQDVLKRRSIPFPCQASL